jgi:hypothetical protein
VGGSPGDGIVPAFSQIGLNHDPNNPSQPQQFLRSFSAVRRIRMNGSHVGYLERLDVMLRLAQCLVNDSCGS